MREDWGRQVLNLRLFPSSFKRPRHPNGRFGRHAVGRIRQPRWRGPVCHSSTGSLECGDIGSHHRSSVATEDCTLRGDQPPFRRSRSRRGALSLRNAHRYVHVLMLMGIGGSMDDHPSWVRHTQGARCLGLFGCHAADAMGWSGGCGGCWSPPGHRPGWCHLPKWSSTRALPSACAPKGCIARALRVLSRRPSVESSTGFGGGFRATGCFAIGELAVYHAVAEGRKVGGSRKAPSVSTLPPIQDKGL